jgi:hypothetical protein
MRKLFILVVFDLLVLLLAGLAFGQSVSPVISEFTGKAAKGKSHAPRVNLTELSDANFGRFCGRNYRV